MRSLQQTEALWEDAFALWLFWVTFLSCIHQRVFLGILKLHDHRNAYRSTGCSTQGISCEFLSVPLCLERSPGPEQRLQAQCIHKGVFLRHSGCTVQTHALELQPRHHLLSSAGALKSNTDSFRGPQQGTPPSRSPMEAYACELTELCAWGAAEDTHIH